jgi:hypothetical protein
MCVCVCEREGAMKERRGKMKTEKGDTQMEKKTEREMAFDP